MYKRDHHNHVSTLLESLDSDLLMRCECYFGGGTAIALLLNEYRESVDVDLLCSSSNGYREIRSIVNRNGLSAIFKNDITIKREAKTDRYGVRGIVEVNDTPIKFEIVSEGRISLDNSGPLINGIKALCRTDMFAEKLLANSDRWSDRSVFSRDIIDIKAMIAAWGDIPHAAKKKAYQAYGESDIETALRRANDLIENEPQYAKKCEVALAITGLQFVTNATEIVNKREYTTSGFKPG